MRDEARLLGALGERPSAVIAQALARAKACADGDMGRGALSAVIEEVQISDVGLAIKVRPEALGEQVSFSIPAQLRRCGMAMRLVVAPQGAHPTRPADRKLVALIAKGQDWFKRLANGQAGSPQAIGDQEGCAAPYVTRLIGLAFLAPDIVERIRRGEQPTDLTASKLVQMVPLPVEWGEQRRLLDIAG